MKKLFSAILAVCMLACGVCAIPAGAQEASRAAYIDDGDGCRASDVLANWSPSLSKSAYGASITLRNFHSGSVTVELHNSSGYITGFTESFTNKISIAPTINRTTASGTYKIVIKITINGNTTTRESSWIGI